MMNSTSPQKKKCTQTSSLTYTSRWFVDVLFTMKVGLTPPFLNFWIHIFVSYNPQEFPLAFPIVAALFITAKQTRDPPKGPQIKEWIAKEVIFTQ